MNEWNSRKELAVEARVMRWLTELNHLFFFSLENEDFTHMTAERDHS